MQEENRVQQAQRGSILTSGFPSCGQVVLCVVWPNHGQRACSSLLLLNMFLACGLKDVVGLPMLSGRFENITAVNSQCFVGVFQSGLDVPVK